MSTTFVLQLLATILIGGVAVILLGGILAGGGVLTTGSKFFFGATSFAIICAIVYSWTTESEYAGLLAFVGLGLSAALLGGAVVAFRDADIRVPAVQAASAADAEGMLPTRSALVSPSMWPIFGGFGVALLLVGLVAGRLYFIGGILVLLAVFVEWMVQAWADRASDDPAYNARLRGRIMHPVEFPIVGALILGLVVFGFSRVMLTVNEHAAVFVFIGVGAFVTLVAVLVSTRRRAPQGLIPIILVAGAVGVLAAGIFGAVRGERVIEKPQDVASEADRSTNAVPDKANPTASVSFKDGAVTVNGAPGNDVVLPKSVPVNLVFKNEGPGKRRLVVDAGKQTVKDASGKDVTQPVTYQTALIDKGKTSFVTFRIGKSGTYQFSIEGEGGSDKVTGTITVP